MRGLIKAVTYTSLVASGVLLTTIAVAWAIDKNMTKFEEDFESLQKRRPSIVGTTEAQTPWREPTQHINWDSEQPLTEFLASINAELGDLKG